MPDSAMTNIAEEIARIATARNTIRAKAVELGIAQTNTGLDGLATAIQAVENRGAVSATVQEGDTYTIPKGYHNGSGTVSGVAGGGSYQLQSKTATPTKLQQNITPDSGFYGLSDVTVEPIPEAYQDVSAVTAGVGGVPPGLVVFPPPRQRKAGGRTGNSGGGRGPVPSTTPAASSRRRNFCLMDAPHLSPKKFRNIIALFSSAGNCYLRTAQQGDRRKKQLRGRDSSGAAVRKGITAPRCPAEAPGAYTGRPWPPGQGPPWPWRRRRRPCRIWGPYPWWPPPPGPLPRRRRR